MGALSDCRGASESLWPLERSTVELSCVNRTVVACVLGYDLPPQGQRGAVERGLDAESEDRCDSQPWDKVLLFP